MQRWIPILAVVLCLQLLVAGALALRRNAVASGPPNSPLVTAHIDGADRIVIDAPAPAGQSAGAASVELRKVGGSWVVHSDYDMPADKSRLDRLLTDLESLKRGLPIGDTKAALARFKVGDDDYLRRVTLSRSGKTLATLYFGESAGLRKTDARTSGDQAVYTVGLAVYELPTEAAGWFDGELLQVPPGKLAELDIRGAGGRHLLLTRQLSADKAPGPWQAADIAAGEQIDTTQVAALARAIGELRVDKVLGTAPQPGWQLQDPVVELTIKESGGRQATWTLSKSKSGDLDILKSSSEPWYFALTETQAKAFVDAGAPDGLLAGHKAPVKPRKLASAALRTVRIRKGR